MENIERRRPTDSITSSETLPNNQSRHCIFISGMGGFHDSLIRVQEGLGEPYGGTENVTVFNSIYSSDQPNPHRFEQIADSIDHHLEKGQLDIVVHSLGATELYRALNVLKKRDENYFGDGDQNKKLHIILVGPSGSSGNFRERVAYLNNVIRMARKELTFTPLPQRSKALVRGVVSLTQFPAKSLAISDKTRKAIPTSWSNIRSGISNILFEPDRENEQYLTPEQIADLTEIDEALDASISNKDRVELLRRRGKIAKEAMKSLLNASKPETASLAKPFKPNFKAKGLLTTLMIAMGGKPINEFKELAKEGVQVSWLVPEYDYIVPIERALSFYAQLEYAVKYVRVQELWPHTGPLAQPKAFGRIVFSLRENIADDSDTELPAEAEIFNREIDTDCPIMLA